MAVPIEPKSEWRKHDSLIHGFAECPTVELANGQKCWAFPGNIIICDPATASVKAEELDLTIRHYVDKTGRTLH